METLLIQLAAHVAKDVSRLTVSLGLTAVGAVVLAVYNGNLAKKLATENVSLRAEVDAFRRTGRFRVVK